MRMVLIGSRRVGETSWAIVGPLRKARISDMGEGDQLMISFRLTSGDIVQQVYTNDGIICLPEECVAVKVSHMETSGKRVSVDLVGDENGAFYSS